MLILFLFKWIEGFEMIKMNDLPNDTELQKMDINALFVLWESRPQFIENTDWVRVAKEVRYRREEIQKCYNRLK